MGNPLVSLPFVPPGPSAFYKREKVLFWGVGQGDAVLATVLKFICPLPGAQELDSDEPSLCVHLPGKTVNKECPRPALPP